MDDAQTQLWVSRAMAAMALVLWVLSLSHPAFIIDNGTGKPSIMSGAEVLVLGWFGFGSITAGWYANLPFLFAMIILLFRTQSPWKSALLGLLLALDTFRLQSLSGDRSSAMSAEGAVTLVFHGYDDDPREIEAIPEVREWFSKLFAAWPYWSFFASRIDQIVPLVLTLLLASSANEIT